MGFSATLRANSKSVKRGDSSHGEALQAVRPTPNIEKNCMFYREAVKSATHKFCGKKAECFIKAAECHLKAKLKPKDC